MCYYQVFLRPSPSAKSKHTHEACIDKSGKHGLISSENEGHEHELEFHNGVWRQTKEDIEKTGHEHPILTITHYHKLTFWEKYNKWIIALIAMVLLYFWISEHSESSKDGPRERSLSAEQLENIISELENME